MASKLWKNIWKVLNTDVDQLLSVEQVTSGSETLKSGTEAAKAVLDLAKTLKEEGSNVQQLDPWMGKISSLLEVLNSPPAQILGASLPFIPLATGLLAFYLKQTKRELSLEECVAFVSQAAYLESLQKTYEFLPEHTLSELNRIGKTRTSAEIVKQIRRLGQKLELDESEAKKALLCFHESKLAHDFNKVLTARFCQAGLNKTQAQLLSRRVAHGTHRYMIQALVEAGDSVKRLADLYRDGWRRDLAKYQSIDNYLDRQIKQKPIERVFDEEFTFQDIYVSLKVQPVKPSGELDERSKPIDIEKWTQKILEDSGKQNQVMFIEGGPGRGKSVFCRMFADWVRQHLYPIWIPILIRLRDITTFDKDLEKTLQTAIGWDFATSDSGWLTDGNTRFLFLLDGFDELLLQGRSDRGLKQFITQVAKFQQRCQENSEKGHRVLITGRSLSLQSPSIELSIPNNLERVKIIPMDDKSQKKWLDKWRIQVGTEKTTAFRQFLQDERLPDRVRELAREPLLLYLLAAMHRDNQLNNEMFEQGSSVETKILIYEQSLNWVLTKQRSDQGYNLNTALTELDVQNLRRILAEAGLCVVQSGGEYASIAMIEQRLRRQGEEYTQALERSQTQDKENPLRNILATFYLQPTSGRDGSVEFVHKSFSDFLFAERLRESLEAWTIKGGKRQTSYEVSRDDMNWEIYDLLGYGGLTPDIVEYLSAWLNTSETIDTGILFERLEDFYFRWCDGDFIDVDTIEKNFPLTKKQQGQDPKFFVGQRLADIHTVDIYTGLNILILLLDLHRLAQDKENLKKTVYFYPCGQPDHDDFDSSRLRRIIGYSYCIGIDVFVQTVGKFLSHAELSGVDLHSADLQGVNLCSANLSNANLSSADLRGVNLSNANLSNTNLSGADLRSANLSSAELSHANLSRANLTGSNFREANLSNAELRGANLDRADFSSTQLNQAFLNHASCRYTNLSGANLSGAELLSTDLMGANLKYGSLSRAILRGADLQDANLSSANISRAFLGGIIWNIETIWDDVSGMDTAFDLPANLRQVFGLGS
jgi:uncharacterized protein YjbI with pentapeptide repeats